MPSPSDQAEADIPIVQLKKPQPLCPHSLHIRNEASETSHQNILGRSLGWEDPLEEGMATHSRILAWRIP